MQVPIYQIDAFSSRRFGGNPAAVCPLDKWPDDETLQAVAAENNLSETAFLVPHGDGYHLRWFTPKLEVALCGHATLASAFVVFEHLKPGSTSVRFESKSGPLFVRRNDDRLAMDFPAQPAVACEPPQALVEGLGSMPHEVYRAADYLAVYDSENDVRAIKPDFRLLETLELRGVIVTAPGDEVDFVSRFFAPAAGIDEDPVTGSAHCTLTPYWSARLEKSQLHARQVSPRGGELWCEDRGDRVTIAGEAVEYLSGTITI